MGDPISSLIPTVNVLPGVGLVTCVLGAAAGVGRELAEATAGADAVSEVGAAGVAVEACTELAVEGARSELPLAEAWSGSGALETAAEAVSGVRSAAAGEDVAAVELDGSPAEAQPDSANTSASELLRIVRATCQNLPVQMRPKSVSPVPNG
ncbi:MAG: hypothetical protein JOZ39_06550 [Chloroflexi bacterium]|nr:hypothetical protein [Chloroflexota bacterium]